MRLATSAPCAFVSTMPVRLASGSALLPLSRARSSSPVRPRARPRTWTACADAGKGARKPGDRATTAALLAAVPALWGSYGVAAKILLATAPGAPAPLLNAVAYAAAALALVAARVAVARRGGGRVKPGEWRATYGLAFELGGYLFLGSWAQLVALETTGAARAAFLVQLTTVLVPLLDVAVLGAPARLRTFASAGAALAGVVVLGGLGGAAALNVGDVLSLVAAVFYTVHVVRLQMVLPKVPSVVRLVEAKAVVQLALGLVAAAVLVPLPQLAAAYAAVAGAGMRDLVVGGLCILWIGAMTSAAATVAQVEGQKRVGPSLSAVVYASQPVFAVFFAILFLHDSLSVREAIGGALVVLAGFAVAI